MNSSDPEQSPDHSESSTGSAPEPSSISSPEGQPPDFATISPLGPPPWEPSRLFPDPRSPLLWADLLYLLLFYLIGGVLIGFIVGVGAMVFFHVPYEQLQNPTGGGAPAAIVTQALLSFATLAFLYVLVRGRTGAPFWPAAGWQRFRSMASRLTSVRYVFLGFALAIATSAVSKYVDNGKTLPMEGLFRSRETVVMLMLLGILVAPFFEETMFRGCLYPVIAKRFGFMASIVATGIAFGCAHAPQLWGGWGQIALLMIVGVILTYIRARAGTVAASYLVHVSYNSILFAALLFATGGLRHLPTH